MKSRRNFLKTVTSIVTSTSISPLALSSSTIKAFDVNSSMKSVTNEEYWTIIRENYLISDLINLNNGGVSPYPLVTQTALEKYSRISNDVPSFSLYQIIDKGREPLRKNLAELAGVSSEEVSFNRNTTEGLNGVIFGLPLKEGDEVVLSKQDYPHMINAWKQREKRDGIVLKWVDLSLPVSNNEEIVRHYTSLFTLKTKIVHITHVINWTGQILPVRMIADIAHQKEIEVVVDGAHSFAHLDFKIPDLGADYFATSLHKWLGAPFGNGFYILKRIKLQRFGLCYQMIFLNLMILENLNL